MPEQIPFRGQRTLKDWRLYEVLTGRRQQNFLHHGLLCFILITSSLLTYHTFDGFWSWVFTLSFINLQGVAFLYLWNLYWVLQKQEKLKQLARENKGWFRSEAGIMTEEGITYRFEGEHGHSEGFIAWTRFADIRFSEDMVVLITSDSEDHGVLTRAGFDSDADWQSGLKILERHFDDCAKQT